MIMQTHAKVFTVYFLTVLKNWAYITIFKILHSLFCNCEEELCMYHNFIPYCIWKKLMMTFHVHFLCLLQYRTSVYCCAATPNEYCGCWWHCWNDMCGLRQPSSNRYLVSTWLFWSQRHFGDYQHQDLLRNGHLWKHNIPKVSDADLCCQARGQQPLYMHSKEWYSRYRAGKLSSYLPSDSQRYATMLDQHYFVRCCNENLHAFYHIIHLSKGGETSSSPTPTDTVRVADTSTFIDTLGAIIMAVEGAIILILLLVLLIVVTWACRMKKAHTKSLGLISKADDDDYTLPPGSSTEWGSFCILVRMSIILFGYNLGWRLKR